MKMKKDKFHLMLPMSRKMFMMHRMEFAQMLNAVTELESLTRADITAIKMKLEDLESFEYVGKKDDDIMVM